MACSTNGQERDGGDNDNENLFRVHTLGHVLLESNYAEDMAFLLLLFDYMFPTHDSIALEPNDMFCINK